MVGDDEDMDDDTGLQERCQAEGLDTAICRRLMYGNPEDTDPVDVADTPTFSLAGDQLRDRDQDQTCVADCEPTYDQDRDRDQNQDQTCTENCEPVPVGDQNQNQGSSGGSTPSGNGQGGKR